MKLTITAQTTQEVEIAIPSYTKCNGEFFAVLSEKTVIKLYAYRSSKSYIISRNPTVNDAYGKGHEIIAKETFFDEYQRIVDDIHEDFENARFLAKDESEYVGENYSSDEEEGMSHE